MVRNMSKIKIGIICLAAFLSISHLFESSAFPEEPDQPIIKSVAVYGGSISIPQIVSFSFGTIIAFPGESFRPDHYHGPWGRGILLQIEPGVAGGKLGIGYGRKEGTGGDAIKAVLLRTWGDPVLADENATYVGLEASVSVFALRLGLGPLYRVTDVDEDDSRWSSILGIGMGF